MKMQELKSENEDHSELYSEMGNSIFDAATTENAADIPHRRVVSDNPAPALLANPLYNRPYSVKECSVEKKQVRISSLQVTADEGMQTIEERGTKHGERESACNACITF